MKNDTKLIVPTAYFIFIFWGPGSIAMHRKLIDSLAQYFADVKFVAAEVLTHLWHEDADELCWKLKFPLDFFWSEPWDSTDSDRRELWIGDILSIFIGKIKRYSSFKFYACFVWHFFI